LGLCCRLFCGFGLSEASAVEAMRKNAKIPVLFMHGEADITVPVSMAEENYAACAAPKRLVKPTGRARRLLPRHRKGTSLSSAIFWRNIS
jgi:fermentation-respiration switch protein FrsA (DUF1100 family)